jgi:hypothetical protein
MDRRAITKLFQSVGNQILMQTAVILQVSLVDSQYLDPNPISPHKARMVVYSWYSLFVSVYSRCLVHTLLSRILLMLKSIYLYIHLVLTKYFRTKRKLHFEISNF